jgi:hypothetical protein
MKSTLVLISIFFYCFSHLLASHIVPITETIEQQNNYWIYRLAFISCFGLFALLAYKFTSKNERLESYLINTLLSFITEDIIDRLIYHDANFHYIDLLVIFTPIVIVIFEFVKSINSKNER